LLFAFSIVGSGAIVAPAFSQNVPQAVEDLSDALDVPFVPSHADVLRAMFAMTKANKGDYVIDLGSGDGRIVIAAAKWLGARGFGVDLNKELVAIANTRAKRQGVAGRAQFFVRDLFATDISKATVVTMYLLPEIVLQLRPKLLATLKPGTRIASHDYHLGDWRPDQTRVIDVHGEERSIVYAWVVPAKVAGSWEWDIDYPRYFNAIAPVTAHIDQHYQDLGGKARFDGGSVPIREAVVNGTKVSFTISAEVDDVIVQQNYVGTVRGDEIVGTVRLSGSVRDVTLPWRAKKRVSATQ
jgi:hypothetical protein